MKKLICVVFGHVYNSGNIHGNICFRCGFVSVSGMPGERKSLKIRASHGSHCDCYHCL